ncbi:glycosyltransferase family 4 protein [Geomesophilobacter sediminis]|uniref:Glycosyltransferase family 4 protein n=1 Tax=Geomesophilobacter sediminis TaxID=2798584 RepID=A0A8J7M1N5_9BACT|nr:glycosyltransferase family 4 protein [Geomesophilobacter sediminis]MBJ6727036.1 glycosyltransferase family 4 protein [Geomesophilobacter sediminis]
MKIVFLAPFGIRPKGTVLARMVPLAAELQKDGHEVVIVAPPYTNPEDSGKTEIVEGVRLVNVQLGPRNKVLAAPILAGRMFRTTLGERPDLVHLFKPKGYGGLAAMLHLALRRTGIRLAPLFLDTDDWEGDGGMNDLHAYSGPEKRFYRFQEQWITRRAAGVTVASRGLEQLVSGMGIAAERLLYLPNSVSAAPPGNGAAARERLGIAAEAPVVLLYTRFFEFSQEKLHYLFAEIYRQVPGVRFVVVGKGRQGEEELLQRVAGESGFAEALAFAGWVEPAAIPDYLAAGDVAIYPFANTLVNRTKCPAKATELLRAERAVVADRVGQLAEYIRDGVSGVLCDPDDWKEMAAETVALLNDPDRQRRLGSAARQYLLDHFNWLLASRRLQDFYASFSLDTPLPRG